MADVEGGHRFCVWFIEDSGDVSSLCSQRFPARTLPIIKYINTGMSFVQLLVNSHNDLIDGLKQDFLYEVVHAESYSYLIPV